PSLLALTFSLLPVFHCAVVVTVVAVVFHLAEPKQVFLAIDAGTFEIPCVLVHHLRGKCLGFLPCAILTVSGHEVRQFLLAGADVDEEEFAVCPAQLRHVAVYAHPYFMGFDIAGRSIEPALLPIFRLHPVFLFEVMHQRTAAARVTTRFRFGDDDVHGFDLKVIQRLPHMLGQLLFPGCRYRPAGGFSLGDVMLQYLSETRFQRFLFPHVAQHLFQRVVHQFQVADGFPYGDGGLRLPLADIPNSGLCAWAMAVSSSIAEYIGTSISPSCLRMNERIRLTPLDSSFFSTSSFRSAGSFLL